MSDFKMKCKECGQEYNFINRLFDSEGSTCEIVAHGDIEFEFKCKYCDFVNIHEEDVY